LFSSEERPTAEALAAIPYDNPFTPPRADHERLVLGDAYRPPDRFLMPGQALHRLEGNLGALLSRAEALLDAARARLRHRQAVGALEREIYEGLVHFVVFHRHAGSFDSLIGPPASTGGPNRVSPGSLFDRCRRDLEALLEPPALGLDGAKTAPRWFALYFQVRRAWVHIFAFIHGGSAAVQALRARLWQSIFTHDMRRYQRSLHARMGDITTLVTGPSGSGKELVARAIGLSRIVPFDQAARAFAADFAGSFHPLVLSALSPTLIESELFGHRRGAFTGATADRAGHFETCGEHGTVLLDEVGETAPEIQVKLLRVLQTRQFMRLGETEPRTFRGRIVAATNRDLAAEIRAGRFREDFFFRLCADRIQTPALRDVLAQDPDELRCLVAHVCAAQAGDAEGPALAEQVVAWVEKKLGPSYPWPGNFRELEQCVRNIMVHGAYDPPLAGARVGGGAASGNADWVEAAREGRLTMDQLLHHYCRHVADAAGSFEEAARRLAADRRTVRRYARRAHSPPS
jgi:DNA-binding NtrC family response regulator